MVFDFLRKKPRRYRLCQSCKLTDYDSEYNNCCEQCWESGIDYRNLFVEFQERVDKKNIEINELNGIVNRVKIRYNEIEVKLSEKDRSKWNKKRLKHERVKLKTILGIPIRPKSQKENQSC